MNLPNFITIGRILLVPITVWLIISGEFSLAFVAFVVAGVSDGVDGYIARKFNQRSELGAYLDPIADKALLVSIYVSLGFLQFLPAWLVILVVTRDVLIVGAVVLAWVVNKPMVVAPSMASKVNTVGQIVLAGLVLGLLGLKISLDAAALRRLRVRGDFDLWVRRIIHARLAAPHGQWQAGVRPRMTLQKQVTFWVVAFLALILVLWLLSPILLPFIAGLVLAYFLDPVADALERLGLPRLVATATILVLSILLLVFIGLLIVPILGDQIVKFAGDLPSLMQSLLARFNEVAPQWIKDAIAKSGTDIQGSISDIAGKAAGWTATLLASVWSGGMALVNILSLMVVTPIVAFYLLADWDRLVAKVDSWLPRDHAAEIRTIFSDIDAALAGFIRGQGTVCLLLGVFYALALTIAGLKFGLVIGLAAGLLSFIPFVGALVGGLVAIGVGLVQFWPDFSSILIIIGIFAAGQFLEGNFLSPKLVGSSIGLHPVWLMFALFAFGYVFGFVGLLLAVPLAAAAGVLVRFALNQYLASKLYRGIPREMPTPVKTPVRKRAK